ncbi:MAG: DUF3034 family protein [Pseudomonadales bacterium]|nr:DUF3034 family protein [Pseudomonadales bacterium]
MTHVKTWATTLFLACAAAPSVAAGGKLQETAGVTQFEGGGGGGLVPWATLSGYDTRDEWSSTVFMTRLSTEDFRLQAYGASVGWHDLLEFSVAEQIFDLKGVPFGERELKMQTLGAKFKVFGDFVYTPYPQISIGMQHKTLQDEFIASALGAEDSRKGTDFYIAAGKAHLGAAAGYNAFWNLTLRATKANQFGFLGFGGSENDSYELLLEGSAGVLLSRNLAVGVEYRQKPENLSGVAEDDAYDVFVAYIPNSTFNLTAAWVELGSIAGSEDQSGLYLSMTGYLW